MLLPKRNTKIVNAVKRAAYFEVYGGLGLSWYLVNFSNHKRGRKLEWAFMRNNPVSSDTQDYWNLKNAIKYHGSAVAAVKAEVFGR